MQTALLLMLLQIEHQPPPLFWQSSPLFVPRCSWMVSLVDVDDDHDHGHDNYVVVHDHDDGDPGLVRVGSACEIWRDRRW